jgi:hypothetical protein
MISSPKTEKSFEGLAKLAALDDPSERVLHAATMQLKIAV